MSTQPQPNEFSDDAAYFKAAFNWAQKENYKLRGVLSATNKVAHEMASTANYHQQRAEAAEAKLKALSEQEPVAWLSATGTTYDCKATMTRYSVGGYYAENAQSVEQRRMMGYKLEPFGHYPDLPKYYAAPVLPVRSEPEPCICLTSIFDNDPETGEKKHCHECGGTGVIQSVDAQEWKRKCAALSDGTVRQAMRIAELERKYREVEFDKFKNEAEAVSAKQRIAELERKLAEQQTTLFMALKWLDKGNLPAVADLLRVHNHEELNSLLSQAREEGRKEACEDSERLDFITSRMECIMPVFDVSRRWRTDGTNSMDEVRTFSGWSIGQSAAEFATPREAIDSAMLAAAPKPEGKP